MLGKGSKRQRKIFHKTGEPPVLFDSSLAFKSVRKMENYLFLNGYLNGSVELVVSYKKKKAWVEYKVDEGQQYKYGKIHYSSDSSIQKDLLEVLSYSDIEVGSPFSQNRLEMERKRISKGLQDKGYFYFDPSTISVAIDSSKGPENLEMNVKILSNSDSISNTKQSINKLIIHGNYSLLLDDIKLDTIQYGAIYVVSSAIEKYDWNKLMHRILLKPGLSHSFGTYFELTYDHLLQTGLFNFIDIKMVPVGKGKMDCHIYLKSGKKKELNLELEGNSGTGTAVQNGNTLGFASRLVFRNKNWFNGGEVLQIALNGGIETVLQSQKGSFFNTRDFNVLTSLEFPRFLLLDNNKISHFRYYASKVNLSYSLEDRQSFLKLQSFDWNLSYQWNKGVRWKHTLAPVDIMYLTAEIRPDIEPLIERNVQLRHSLENQWIMGSDYRFSHSNQRGTKDRSFYILNGEVNVAGNIFRLANLALGEHAIDSIAGVTYSQFVKVQGDVRKYINFSNGKSAAFRLLGGIGRAYGNTSSLPYVKQFFIGGANSIRAWRLRTLGPGGYIDSTLQEDFVILDQTGEMKLEWNSEFRFPLSKSLKAAIFVDVGNIWNLHVDRWRPGGKFELSNLADDLAIGSGFGLRWDFSYFIIRLDYGMKMKDPRLESGQQWVLFNDDSWKEANPNYEYSVLNLAIGYPF